MASVAFLRGVNVGGHRTFQPSALAKELAGLDAVNVGAAGTLVIRKKIGQGALRNEIQQRLPFEAQLMICTGRELLDLAWEDTAPEEPAARRFVSVLARRPRELPPLPLEQPAGAEWQVKVVGVAGKFALSLWRRLGKRLLYPNGVVEKKLGVPATTRGWDTIAAVRAILEGG
jgi:uncharacterized protein (DUF1697 family)